jgi:hypothetical protein
VAATYPAAGAAHGFTGYVRLTRGTHQVCAYAINTGQGTTNPSLGCRSVVVP